MPTAIQSTASTHPDRGTWPRGAAATSRIDLIPQLPRATSSTTSPWPASSRWWSTAATRTASAVAPALYRALGCEVVELHCDLESGLPRDGCRTPSVPSSTARPGRPGGGQGGGPRASPSTATATASAWSTPRGGFIAADRVLMLLAADVLSRTPGHATWSIDVKCTRHLAEEIRRGGGRPVMWRSGHAPLKAKLRESGALIAGELSGHIIFQERWFGFDDAIYAGARLLEVLSLDPRPRPRDLRGPARAALVTPELALPLQEGEPERIMQSVMRLADRLDGVES